MSFGNENRNYYLKDIPLSKAVSILDEWILDAGSSFEEEDELVRLEDAVGRVVSGTIFAKISSPITNTAAMDGIATHSSKTIGATDNTPVFLKHVSDYIWIDTGDPMPDGMDSVVMIEDVLKVSEDEIQIRASVYPYQHIRKIAEDIATTEILLQKGSEIRVSDIPCLAAGGYSSISVLRKPRVAIIPTGNELVPIGSIPKPGEVIEFNSLMISTQVQGWGGVPEVLEFLPDESQRIQYKLKEITTKYDLIILIAGSSAGSEDYTSGSIDSIGKVHFHGVAIRPGHPVIFGEVDGTPIFGLPGYPSSTFITSQLFVKKIVLNMLGQTIPLSDFVNAKISRKTMSPMGEDEFMRVNLGKVGGDFIATPSPRGAAMTLSMSRSDGIGHIPSRKEGLDEGENIVVELTRERRSIENTIILSGSDDIALHLLAEEISDLYKDLRLVTSSVGSVGGLIALSKGYAHLAGSHLLDTETGVYNQSAVTRFLPDQKVRLYDFVGRTQGLIFAKNNHKKISGLKSIVENDCLFINRQIGSGTRLFVDYKLDELNIARESIRGYDNEEYTHWTVAAAISGGYADVGVGIEAAALSNDLEFIPLGEEKYQLVILEDQLEDNPNVYRLIECLKSEKLKAKIDALGGYDVSEMGRYITVN